MSRWNESRRGFLGLAAGSLATAGLAGRAGGEAVRPAPKRGGTLTILVEPEPPSLVAFNNTAGPLLIVSPKVTEGLLNYAPDLTPLPQLAISWAVSEDGRRYTFRLRQGVKWHDGKDFTSADVAYSILLLKKAHPRGRTSFGTVEEVRTPDPHTAIFELSAPAPFLLTALAACESPILPRHIYDGTEPASNPAQNAPIGTGPFLFKEWVKGSHIIYERNPNYWDPGKPYIDRLIVRFLPDPLARVIAIETGTADLVAEVPRNELARLAAIPHLGIEQRPRPYFAGTTGTEINLKHPILSKLPVRQAIAHALNREAVAEIGWYGYAVPTLSPVSPALPQFYNGKVEPYAFDPRRSERLLDEAGYPRKANGFRFDLVHDYYPYGDSYKRVADYTRSALARIGINITVRSQDLASYMKRVYTDLDYELAYHWFTNTFDPSIGLQRFFWSKAIRPGVAFVNVSQYSDPEVDRLLEAAAVEPDPVKRKAQLDRFQEIVVRDLPVINLVSVKDSFVYNKRVRDHSVDALSLSNNFADIHLAG